MQNVGFVRRSSNQLHHKNIFHLTGAAHHIHQQSKYWKTHQNHKTWNISSWNDGAHKTASASKNQNAILLSRKCSWRLEKTGCIEEEQWNSHKKNGSYWKEGGTQKHEVRKARVRVVSRQKSEATEKTYSFILGRHNKIHEKSKYSITQHIHKTWNKSE